MKNYNVLRDVMGDAVSGGIGAAFSAPQGQYVAPELSEPSAPPTPPVGTYAPNPLWNTLKEQFQIETPTDLNATNEAQMFADRVKTISQPQAPLNLHPSALELNQNLQKPDFDYNAWLTQQSQQVNLTKAEGAEFYKPYLKIRYPNVTEEAANKIVENLEKAGTLELEVLKAKEEFTYMQTQQSQARNAAAQVEMKTIIATEQTKIDTDLQTLFASTQKYTDIYGVNVGKAEIDAFNSTFAELAKLDEHGKSSLGLLLQSDEDVYRFAYLSTFGNQKIKQALFEAKEGTKAEIFRKIKGGQAFPTPQSVPTQNAPNYSAFAQPQR